MYVVTIDLCGEEILGDYPHDEVANPGVNHFPEGVFQRCRHMILKDKEAERLRLKKIKRQRNNAKARLQSTAPNAVVQTHGDGFDDDEWGGVAEGPAVPVDRVDLQWDMVAAGATPAAVTASTPQRRGTQQQQGRVHPNR